MHPILTRRAPAALLGVLAVCLALWPTQGQGAEASYTLRFGALVLDGTPWDDHLRELQRGVEERSGGAIAFRLYENDIAPSELSLVRDCASGGTFNGVAVSNSALAGGLQLPLFEMLQLPYLFRDEREADAVLDGTVFPYADRALREIGLVLGAWSETGWYSFATINGPIMAPLDLASHSFRVQEISVLEATHADLGLSSRPLSRGVVPRFLETGEIQGLDSTAFYILAAGWAGSLDYFTLTRHSYAPAEILYSRSFFDALPPDLQAALLGDPAREAAAARRLVRDLDARMLEELQRQGIEVVTLEPNILDAFARSTDSVHLDFLAEHNDQRPLYDEIQAQLTALRAMPPTPTPEPTPRRRFRHGSHHPHQP